MKQLTDLNIKVILIEEAAQVLESRCVCLLNQSIEHLIMIGDHYQLRPQVEDIILKENYHLDLSLFERLIKNNQGIKKLNVQRRMRPEISVILKAFYDFPIFNHESVLQREKVRGVGCDIGFINLDYSTEERIKSSTSYFNNEEAEYCCQLAIYLIFQG